MRRLLLFVALLWIGAVPLGAAAPKFRTSPKASVLVCGGSMMHGAHFADPVLAVMREHYAGVKHVVLVLHASAPADRDRAEAALKAAFADLGIEAESLHHADLDAQRVLLERAEGIFVGGGETFVLLGELYRTGQLGLIRSRVLAGVPYGGSSAGANVAGLLIGTTNDFPTTEVPSREALAIFPAVINPHHPLPHEQKEFEARARKLRDYLKFNPTETVLALANAGVARLHAGRARLEAGCAWVYRRGGIRAVEAGGELPELFGTPVSTPAAVGH